jgi:hypothetical protein
MRHGFAQAAAAAHDHCRPATEINFHASKPSCLIEMPFNAWRRAPGRTSKWRKQPPRRP